MQGVTGGHLLLLHSADTSPPKPMSDTMTAVDQPGEDRVSEDGELWRDAAIQFDRFRSGDRMALDNLVRLLTPVLWQVVRAYGLERTRAEDVVQTTWLMLVRRHDTIRNPQAVSSWIIITARREAWRVAKLADRITPVEDDVLERRSPVGESPEAQVMLDDSQRRLWEAVSTLGDRCRRLLRVIAFDARPDYQGIAEELAMPIGSIGPTRGRCLAKLRAALTEGDAG